KPGTNDLRIFLKSPMRYGREMRPDHTGHEMLDPVGGRSRIRKKQCDFGWDWGPRLTGVGIFGEAVIEAWSGARLESVRTTQKHEEDKVTLELMPETRGNEAGLQFKAALYAPDGSLVEEKSGPVAQAPFSLVVNDPQLWWPHSMGEHPLYELKTEIVDAQGKVLDEWDRRIGLRTIELDTTKDNEGYVFGFVINGRPFFAKGANWIPAHTFNSKMDDHYYIDLLNDSIAADMNMIRIWGGGMYEQDIFYQLCDELGLLVWQDFMFACSEYPDDQAFYDTVRDEAEAQVKRLRHHASLALWCGNNEVEMLYGKKGRKDPDWSRAYDELFKELLPSVVEAEDGVTAYWHSSPWGDRYDFEDTVEGYFGDTHYWAVWHGRLPINDFFWQRFRFLSEYGVQSFPSPATIATAVGTENPNIYSAEMDAHQKGGDKGNTLIQQYMSVWFQLPKDYAAMAYLSQVHQGMALKTAIESLRRATPFSRGSLYWQLNDCWPGPSWSSVEFGGKWKASHYIVRRAHQPVIAICEPKGNWRIPSPGETPAHAGEVILHVAYDGADDDWQGTGRWSLVTLDGEVLRSGEKAITAPHMDAVV
ncbi:MAG: glycoside hydrolase family 2 protein, partial [Verrucomicrobiota bacterium]